MCEPHWFKSSPPHHILMENYSKQYLAYIQDRGYARNTVSAYAGDMQVLREYLDSIGIQRPDMITTETVEGYAKYLEGRERVRGTAKRRMSCLRHFLRWLWDEGVIDTIPGLGVRVAYEPPNTPVFLSEGDVSALLNAPLTDDHIGKRDRAVMELLYNPGIMPGELLALNVPDVLIDRALLRVAGRKQPILPLGTHGVSKLVEYLAVRHCFKPAPHEPALFLSRRHVRISDVKAVRRWLYKYGQQILGRSVTPTMLRHSYLVHCARAGMSLPDLWSIRGDSKMDGTWSVLMRFGDAVGDITVPSLRKERRLGNGRVLQ